MLHTLCRVAAAALFQISFRSQSRLASRLDQSNLLVLCIKHDAPKSQVPSTREREQGNDVSGDEGRVQCIVHIERAIQ